MTHQEAQLNDTVERYVRHQLSGNERRAFQEHYFECEECFEQVQTMARFVAGVQHAARKGLLIESAKQPWWATLFRPAMVIATATALLLAVGFGWMWFTQNSSPNENLAITQTPKPQPTASVEASATPFTQESPKPQQQDLLALNRPTPAPGLAPGKTPFVVLDSERGASSTANQLTIPVNATNAILRIEVEPDSSFSSFQFQIFDNSKRLVATAKTGKASSNGMVSANISTQSLQSGKYVVKCYGSRDGQRELVGEYRLQVQKP